MKPTRIASTTVAELQRIADVEDAHQAETHAWHLRMVAASAEVGYAGDLRRAIDAARWNPERLAAASSIDVNRLESFRAGEASLNVAEVGRLLDALGLALAPVHAAG